MARSARVVTTRRFIVYSVLLGLLLLAVPHPASAVTPEEVAAATGGGIYVQPGAEDVDLDQLREAIAAGEAAGLDLTVAVLADDVDAVTFAASLGDVVGGTVMVYTPSQYGVTSDEIGQARLTEVLTKAAASLGTGSIPDGVDAFVEAAAPGSTNWGLIVLAGVVLVAAVAVVGRLTERRSAADRRQAALQRAWKGLSQRADLLADPVLELSTRVELDGRDELIARYREAASAYGDIRDALAQPPGAKAVDAIDADLSRVESQIEAITATLG